MNPNQPTCDCIYPCASPTLPLFILHSLYTAQPADCQDPTRASSAFTFGHTPQPPPLLTPRLHAPHNAPPPTHAAQPRIARSLRCTVPHRTTPSVPTRIQHTPRLLHAHALPTHCTHLTLQTLHTVHSPCSVAHTPTLNLHTAKPSRCTLLTWQPPKAHTLCRPSDTPHPHCRAPIRAYTATTVHASNPQQQDLDTHAREHMGLPRHESPSLLVMTPIAQSGNAQVWRCGTEYGA